MEKPNAVLTDAANWIASDAMDHAMACEYPEGCSCGASRYNGQAAALVTRIRALLPLGSEGAGKDRFYDAKSVTKSAAVPAEGSTTRGILPGEEAESQKAPAAETYAHPPGTLARFCKFCGGRGEPIFEHLLAGGPFIQL